MASSNNECDREWKKFLPIGFHFVPTDEELIMYLKLKSCNGKIPPGIFNDLDIYQYEPQQLFGFAEKHWDGSMYFFTLLRKKDDNGKRIERVIHSYSRKGCWKASQARKDLYKNNNLIGTKTSLVYYEWLMLEYRFSNELDSLPLFNGSDYELTLCVIYYYSTKKNDSSKKNVDDQIAMSSDDPIPLESPIDQNFNHSAYTLWSIEYSSLEQFQPLINRTDFAATSTMQPSFSQLPYGVMNKFDISP